MQEHLRKLQQIAYNTAASQAERGQANAAALALLASLQTANVEWAPRLPSPAGGAPVSGAQSMQRGQSQDAPIQADQAAAARRAALESVARITVQPANPQLLAQRADPAPQAVNGLSLQAKLRPTESLGEAQVTAARTTAQEAAGRPDKSDAGRLSIGQASKLSTDKKDSRQSRWFLHAHD